MNYVGHFEDKDGNKYFTGIVKSGSNENGNYVLFADGTMICWTTIVGKTFDCTQLPTGSYYYKDADGTENIKQWFFPSVFNSVPTVSCTVSSKRLYNDFDGRRDKNSSSRLLCYAIFSKQYDFYMEFYCNRKMEIRQLNNKKIYEL